MSYNKSIFQGVPKKNVNKSRFNLSHEYKAGLTLGRLIPIMVLECLPQDEFNIDTEFMFRFAPLYFPIMHKITMRADYYYIPNRILWPGRWDDEGGIEMGWKEWIAHAETSETIAHPVMSSEQGLDVTRLQNVMTYMGLPIGIEDPGLTTTIISDINAFPLSAYLKIFDEYYRIPQLEDERWFPLRPGDMTAGFEAAFEITTADKYYIPLSAKWEKDYFTSALPTPQLGDAIQIPMVGDTELHASGLPVDGPWRHRKVSDNTPAVGPNNVVIATGGTGKEQVGAVDTYIDIQETAATIKQLRIAEVLQSYYERIMKVGQRYRDFIEGLWGDDPQPGDVDVPVLLGSKFGRVQISDVMTQALTIPTDPAVGRDTGDYTGQANMYSNDGGNINYKSNEHGWLMCILQLNANTSYGQGVERFWRRNIQTDYPLDMFSGIGDQEILKEELLRNFNNTGLTKNDDTWGYIPRFSEMRFKNNIQIGILNFNTGRSTHLGRILEEEIQTDSNYDLLEINALFTNSAAITEPIFGADSVGAGTRITDVFRTLPVNSMEGTLEASDIIIYAHIFHSVYVNRALPMFSTPQSI